MKLELPPLPYAYDALAPYMSSETLELHHDKHHQAYVTNANKLLGDADIKAASLSELVIAAHSRGSTLFDNVGQHFNHLHFWHSMKPGGGGEKKIPQELEISLHQDFGGYDGFKDAFIAAGVGQFGSGWAWLSVRDGRLEVVKTPNAESPLLAGGWPILGVDVWEHACYVDYRNRRADYMKAFLEHLVNWDHVLELWEQAPQ